MSVQGRRTGHDIGEEISRKVRVYLQTFKGELRPQVGNGHGDGLSHSGSSGYFFVLWCANGLGAGSVPAVKYTGHERVHQREQVRHRRNTRMYRKEVGLKLERRGNNK